jgi:hypothetical protein
MEHDGVPRPDELSELVRRAEQVEPPGATPDASGESVHASAASSRSEAATVREEVKL